MAWVAEWSRPLAVDLSNNVDVAGAILQICLIDLLLSGDNAILIAMACRSLPAALRRRAVLLGTGAAVLFRVILSFAATLALRAPFLKLVGAVLLLLIAIELMAGAATDRKIEPAGGAGAGLWKAIAMIVAADAVMSLDNVVAVAAAAQDQLMLLFLGLLISVPILVFASLFVARLLDAHPLLVDAGAALLGWIAGKTAVSDPAIAGVLEAQSFGLVALAPVLGAAYVIVQGRLLRAQRAPERGRPAAAPALVLAAGPVAPPPRTPAAPLTAPAAIVPPGLLQRFTPMDLAIMAGVAIPLVGFVVTIAYMIARAVARHA
jgi:YjbE family integral membrane protein